MAEWELPRPGSERRGAWPGSAWVSADASHWQHPCRFPLSASGEESVDSALCHFEQASRANKNGATPEPQGRFASAGCLAGPPLTVHNISAAGVGGFRIYLAGGDAEHGLSLDAAGICGAMEVFNRNGAGRAAEDSRDRTSPAWKPAAHMKPPSPFVDVLLRQPPLRHTVT